MRNWVIGALIGAFTMTVGSFVAALDSDAVITRINATFDQCKLNGVFDGDNGTASVWVERINDANEKYLLETSWQGGGKRLTLASGDEEFDTAIVAARCLTPGMNKSIADVSLFAADADSFAEEDKIGMKFTVVTPADGIFNYNDERLNVELLIEVAEPPALSSSSPADDGAYQDINSNITLTFSKDVQFGAGNITISDGAGDTRTIGVDTDDPQISVSGQTVTINPATALNYSSNYYVQIDASAIEDLSGNSYAGIADTTTLNFSTATVPTAPTNLVATAGDGEVSVAFTEPLSDGGDAINSYEYSVADGVWNPATETESPVVITDLTNGTEYSIKLRAINLAGNGAESQAVSATPADTTAPAGYTIDLVSGVPNTTVVRRFATISFYGAEIGSTYNYVISSDAGGDDVVGSGTVENVIDSVNVNYNPQINVQSLNDGILTASLTLTDAAGNVGVAATDTIVKDYTPPAGFDFSMDQNAITASNATSVSFTMTGAEVGTTYKLYVGDAELTSGTVQAADETIGQINFSSVEDGDLTVGLELVDEAGNKSDKVTKTIVKDSTGPTTTLSYANIEAHDLSEQGRIADMSAGFFSEQYSPYTNLSDPVGMKVEFSETVVGFTIDDISVVNGSVSNFNDSAAPEYTFDVTPTAEGLVTIDVAQSVVEDSAGNGNASATQASFVYDATKPVATLETNASTDPDVPHTEDTIEIQAVFSEQYVFPNMGEPELLALIGLTEGMPELLEISNAEIVNAIPEAGVFILKPTVEDGVVTFGARAGAFVDRAFNTGDAVEPLSITVDLSHPTVVLTSTANAFQSGSFSVTATFSEDVTGFDAGDLSVNNVTVSNFAATSASVYTFDVTPVEDGALTVEVLADVAVDGSGNGNLASTQLSVTADSTAPTVTLTSDANALHSGLFTVTATFSEAMIGFDISDVTVGNGSASNFDDSAAPIYTFDVTPTADGAVTVDIAAGVAADAAGNNNAAATQLNVDTDNTDPVLTITGPTEVVVDDFKVTFSFSEDVQGFTLDDVVVTNSTKGELTELTANKVYELDVTEPELGQVVSISVAANVAQDAAGNGNEAALFEVSAGSPASEFEKDKAEIKQDIVAEVQNTLQNAVTANVRLVKEAKSRFITSTRSSLNGPAGFAGQNNVPFDVDGVANGTAMRLSTNGTFFGQVGNDEGTKRRVFFGDFSIVGEKGGSVTGSISGKVAWEQNLSDKTMYGYFIGAQVNQTDIKTMYSGKQQGYGVNIGSYVVTEVAENVYIDGFVSLGMGKSDLDMSNDVLSLDGSYETKSATIGGALTGVYDMESYEFWPELAYTVGKTQVGTAKFTGRAYGLVDNNLSLDVGDVTVANLTLRPEVRIPLEAGNQSGATSQVTFAPRAICERITTDVTIENCGRGAELGFIRKSGDGLTQITGRLSRDYVGTSTRTGLELKLEHRF